MDINININMNLILSQSKSHESNITIDNNAYTCKLMISDEDLNITVENNQSKSIFYAEYSCSEILNITSEAGFPSSMAQLYEMLIASMVSTSTTSPKEEINLCLDIKIQDAEDPNDQKMILELILTFDGKLKRTYKYVFELLSIIADVDDNVSQLELKKLSHRVSQLETLSDRVAKLEKLLEQNSNLIDTNCQAKCKNPRPIDSNNECPIDNEDVLELSKRGFQWNCENGNLITAKWLYSLGDVDIHVNDEYAFKSACRNGHLAVAKWLHSLGGLDIRVCGGYAFPMSCQNGYLDVAQWLYSLGGIDIHAEDEYAFRWSCRYGHLDVAQWLYSLGGYSILNIHADNAYAFKWSCKNGHLATARWLYTLGGLSVPKHAYVCEHYPEEVLNWLKQIWN